MPKSLRKQLFKKENVTKGGRGQKSAKKSHVLFEWPGPYHKDYKYGLKEFEIDRWSTKAKKVQNSCTELD